MQKSNNFVDFKQYKKSNDFADFKQHKKGNDFAGFKALIFQFTPNTVSQATFGYVLLTVQHQCYL